MASSLGDGWQNDDPHRTSCLHLKTTFFIFFFKRSILAHIKLYFPSDPIPTMKLEFCLVAMVTTPEGPTQNAL